MSFKYFLWGGVLFAVATIAFSALGYLYYSKAGVEEASINDQQNEKANESSENEIFPVLPDPDIIPVPVPKLTNNDTTCTTIANDESLRSLPDALLLLFGSSKMTEAKDVVRQAITNLRRISEDANDSLAPKLNNTAYALDILISTPAPTEEMVNNAVEALDDLGKAVQTVCGFF